MTDLQALLRRVRWLPVIVVLLCLGAIVWVLITPGDWTSCLVLVLAAVPIAILERSSPR